ncbi:MAG: hypothetical protein KJT03_03290, partial [Verrucomicrobiae bacterium]|nr:hypothetical protein [Verrucomicrobiae bacterium]
DPEAAKLLQTHVKQMEGRLKEGLMVRAWDPAYVEFVNHYDDIDIQFTAIENGISVVATGKTDAARQVARNHAGIISKFIEHGWAEHDKSHTAVFASEETAGKGMHHMGMGKGMEMGKGMSNFSCCQKGDDETAQADLECSREGEAGCMMETKSAGGGPSCCMQERA